MILTSSRVLRYLLLQSIHGQLIIISPSVECLNAYSRKFSTPLIYSVHDLVDASKIYQPSFYLHHLMVQTVNLHKSILNKHELSFIPDLNKNHTLYRFFSKASTNNIKACKLQRKSMLVLQPSCKKQHQTFYI